MGPIPSCSASATPLSSPPWRCRPISWCQACLHASRHLLQAPSCHTPLPCTRWRSKRCSHGLWRSACLVLYSPVWICQFPVIFILALPLMTEHHKAAGRLLKSSCSPVARQVSHNSVHIALQAAANGAGQCIACTLWAAFVQVSSNPALALRASMNMDSQAPMTGIPDHDYAVQMSAHHRVYSFPGNNTCLHFGLVPCLQGTD